MLQDVFAVIDTRKELLVRILGEDARCSHYWARQRPPACFFIYAFWEDTRCSHYWVRLRLPAFGTHIHTLGLF